MGSNIFPAEGGSAALAEDVTHGVQTSQQNPVLARPTRYVHSETSSSNTVRFSLPTLSEV